MGFDGAGNGLGDEFTVNSYTSSSQYDPSIAALEGGGFAITWQDDSGHSGGSSSDIRVQLFDAVGGSVGSEQLVNSYVGDVQNHPTVTGLAGGGYVVAYRDNAGSSRSDDDVTGKDDDIWAQIYNSDGSKAGAEFRMNATVTEDQQYPTITGLNNGGFA